MQDNKAADFTGLSCMVFTCKWAPHFVDIGKASDKAGEKIHLNVSLLTRNLMCARKSMMLDFTH